MRSYGESSKAVMDELSLLIGKVSNEEIEAYVEALLGA